MIETKKEEKPFWEKMIQPAWRARENARVLGKTKVGACGLSEIGGMCSGCNVEHKFRSHDIHAETNVISSIIANGYGKLKAILIVAEREQFTPCGSCMDWIFEIGGSECIVGFQNNPNGEIKEYVAGDLMPFYPK